jgi:WYL_2, Sm-like SH3 beta-barrel fold
MTEAWINCPNAAGWTDEEAGRFRTMLQGILSNAEVVVTFDKIDGSERIMTCTLNPTVIPTPPAKPVVEGALPKTEPKKRSESVLAVYDVNAKGWRSFKIKSVKKVTFPI